jgi:hypothetical protein
MRNILRKHFFYFIGLFALAAVVGLWSWNTLSELFNFPQAQYKHALAALFLLIILRWGLAPGHRRIHRASGSGGSHEHSVH